MPTTVRAAPLVVFLLASAGSSTALVRSISFQDVRPLLESLRADLLPREVTSLQGSDRPSAWLEWIGRRDRDIRARLERGDRDAVVNFLMFGSSFTARARPAGADIAALGEQPPRVTTLFAERLNDLVRALAAPGTNERIQIARTLLEQAGIDLATDAGRRRAHEYLREALTAAPPELTTYAKEVGTGGDRVGAAFVPASTSFRYRGLASDTSIAVNAALHQALTLIRARGDVSIPPSGQASLERAAIVGPGLDITDKHDGHDFYPVQTIQPFAVIDSLVGLGLARADRLRLTALDVSPRVVNHLEQARQRADRGVAYTVHLPRNVDLPWGAALANYWDGFGEHIGDRARQPPVPPAVGKVRLRSIAVRPAIVRSIDARDLNIVAQRLEMAADERFDLVVATDVLLYYDVFEQSLALTNIAAMLRPGGLLLTNTPLFELPAIPMDLAGSLDVVHMTLPIAGDIRDRMLWYRRRSS